MQPTTADRAEGPETVTPPPATTTEGADLAWVSWLRVLAIVGVVLIHVTSASATPEDSWETPVGRLAIVLDFGSRWAVPVFVMLSGALLLDPARYRGDADFLRRRALRLVPAVVVWHLVYLVYVVALTDRASDPATLLSHTLNGRLYTALYFFWIVLGLALVTPVLMAWWSRATPRARQLVAAGALGASVLTVLTVPVRQVSVAWVETPWTWWIPYLGYYLLGHALREVVLRGWQLLAAAVVAVGGSASLVWHWRATSGVGGVLERYAPAETYYGPVVAAVAIAVFLLARALVRHGGVLGVLSGAGASHLGRRLGEVTLGVFAVHLLVLAAVLELPVVGGTPAATGTGQLLARAAIVLLASYLIALVASRVPVLRRVF